MRRAVRSQIPVPAKAAVLLARQEENRRSGPRSTRNNEESGRPRTARGDDAGRSRGPRDDAGRSLGPRDDSARGRRSDRDDRGFSDSPWRTVSRLPVAAEADAGDEAASSKPVIDPELIRRQRQEETRVYGENAC